MGPTNPTHWCIAKMSGFSTTISKGPQQRCRWAEAVDSHTVWGARHGDWLVHNCWESSTGWWFGTFLFPSTGKSNPNWRTHIFRGGRYTTIQPQYPTLWQVPRCSSRCCNWTRVSMTLCVWNKNWQHFFGQQWGGCTDGQKNWFSYGFMRPWLGQETWDPTIREKTLKKCWVYLPDLHQSSKKRSSFGLFWDFQTTRIRVRIPKRPLDLCELSATLGPEPFKAIATRNKTNIYTCQTRPMAMIYPWQPVFVLACWMVWT
jgi:hypothetical protein